MTRMGLTSLTAMALVHGAPGAAEDLYKKGNWAAMSADRRASQVGDLLTVVVYQSAEASNVAENGSRKTSSIGGSLRAGPIDEGGDLSFGGSYNGRGEVRRSERLVTQISVTVEAVLPNGDYIIRGQQKMRVNGELSDIGVRGRIRSADITADNRILSSRIADAEINYDGKGFVSRSAKPGLINRIFSFLGLA
ncbi:flagellar basal body L-ring protein FlgH [Sphingomonas gilva]|uniref:Flagellar basal body L-ring protein FlgH n=1 Tax=Sphingomonas gilva TaxID=2305907 RepID=A0A396RSC0_9SPHN|nr:flagellar basal body L-ring protein FlgH [Sphingomonas gilva]RHW18966.1 flagellar basal body L-ring protein FlgH [Sphingomonas gilva]